MKLQKIYLRKTEIKRKYSDNCLKSPLASDENKVQRQVWTNKETPIGDHHSLLYFFNNILEFASLGEMIFIVYIPTINLNGTVV